MTIAEILKEVTAVIFIAGACAWTMVGADEYRNGTRLSRIIHLFVASSMFYSAIRWIP